MPSPTELEQLNDLYLAIGVGGMSFIVLIIVLGFLLKQVIPILHEIRGNELVTKEVLQNNTKAIQELAKSNENVATALTILDKSLYGVHSDVKSVQQASDEIVKTLLVMDEKLKR